MRAALSDLQRYYADVRKNWRRDLLSGFLVSLIALPLCLGISMASGFPPVAGLYTAIIGGVMVSFLGGSELAIKGPAAGLIVVALGAVEELGQGDMWRGYTMTLATIVIAGLFQVLFGLFRWGTIADFFPSTVIHGMMAAIGIIIISKQIHVLLGVKPEATDIIGSLAAVPKSVVGMNPLIALIGLNGLLILFVIPYIQNRVVNILPGPLVVIIVAVLLSVFFRLKEEHAYIFHQQRFVVGPDYLVSLPNNLFSGFTFPDFSVVFSAVSIKYIIMFALIGSIESLLSNKAIDVLDPYKRKTEFNRDLLGVGIGNILAGLVGGLPMISEIVRSSANVHNGARTRWSNFFHGTFLLIFVVFFPSLIQSIPLAALAAILVYTGFRLASPKVFYDIYKIGKEQLFVFLVTVFMTLATDLLIGIVSGVLVKILYHIYLGLPVRSIWRLHYTISHQEPATLHIGISGGAVFTNFLRLRKLLESQPKNVHVIIDFDKCGLIDHTVMKQLKQYAFDYQKAGGSFIITGLEKHRKLSAHACAIHVKKINSQSADSAGASSSVHNHINETPQKNE